MSDQEPAAETAPAATPEPDPAAVARYYYRAKNPDGAAFGGVPLRDLTVAEWESLPAWLRASVAAAPFYGETPPEPEPADEEGLSDG